MYMKNYIFIIILCSNWCYAQQQIEWADTSYYPSGKINFITKKINKDLSQTTQYYENGNIKYESSLYYDEKTSEAFYNADIRGKQDSSITYSKGKNLETHYKPGQIIYYNKNKKITSKYFYVSSGYDSTIAYSEEGNIELIRQHYTLNEITRDTFMYYYKNGIVKYTGAHKNDKMYGTRLCFTENGKLVNGYFSSYDQDGRLRKECICINGKPEGEMRIYNYGDDCLSQLVNFKDGKPDGLTYYYGYAEKPTSIQIYKNGVFVKNESVVKSNK